MARRDGSGSVKHEEAGDPEASGSRGAGRRGVHRTAYALLLVVVAALAAALGFPQVGIALAGGAAVVLVLMGIAWSESSPETAHPEDPPGAKTSYSAAVAEVLSRGTLGPDSLAELHAIDQQFAESVQAKSVPAGVGTPLREAERPVARKNPPGRASPQSTICAPERKNASLDSPSNIWTAVAMKTSTCIATPQTFAKCNSSQTICVSTLVPT